MEISFDFTICINDNSSAADEINSSIKRRTYLARRRLI